MKRLAIASLLLLAGCSAPRTSTVSTSIPTPPLRDPALNPLPGDSTFGQSRPGSAPTERPPVLPKLNLDPKTGSRLTRNGRLSPLIAASFQTLERAKTLAQLNTLWGENHGLIGVAQSEAQQVEAKGTPLQKEVARLRLEALTLTEMAANDKITAFQFQVKSNVIDPSANGFDPSAITPSGRPLVSFPPQERQRLIEAARKPSRFRPIALKLARYADELPRYPRRLARVQREVKRMRQQPPAP